jgi:hypothetical protein
VEGKGCENNLDVFKIRLNSNSGANFHTPHTLQMNPGRHSTNGHFFWLSQTAEKLIFLVSQEIK